MKPFPAEVERLLWDVDPGAVDPTAHRDFVLERVMSRGGLVAMRWLRESFEGEVVADFLRRRGDRLSPRDRAYWRLVFGLVPLDEPPGGGRPPWLA